MAMDTERASTVGLAAGLRGRGEEIFSQNCISPDTTLSCITASLMPDCAAVISLVGVTTNSDVMPLLAGDE